ncbi:MAG: hypothetical protein CMK59_14905, partial [Proteobacteria bacterium]|nr:hypothetical protein [Pseudomonadota bacterium]
MLIMLLACSSNKVLDEGDEFDDKSASDTVTGIETPPGDTDQPEDQEPEDQENDNGDPQDVPQDDPDEPEPEISVANIEVCYPGADLSYSLCFETVEHQTSWGGDYEYPEPYQGNPQYQKPVRFLDLSTLDSSTPIAGNFVAGEFMQEYKGRFGLFSPEIVARLQLVRDDMGAPLNVSSAYRNITYNAGVGGVEHSRHMYGDAVDLYGSSTSLGDIQALCEAHGAYFTSLYESHVHCDWRETELEPAFYDATIRSAVLLRDELTRNVDAEVILTPDGYHVEHYGFDEGTPQIDWFVYDEDDYLIGHWFGEHFFSDLTDVRIEVVVGGIIH